MRQATKALATALAPYRLQRPQTPKLGGAHRRGRLAFDDDEALRRELDAPIELAPERFVVIECKTAAR